MKRDKKLLHALHKLKAAENYADQSRRLVREALRELDAVTKTKPEPKA